MESTYRGHDPSEEDLVIRRFREGDEEGVCRIYRGFFEEVPSQFLKEEGFFVAVLGEDIVGFVLVPCFQQIPYFETQDSVRDVKSYCFLEELHVHHDCQRRGIGSALTMRAVEYARSRGADAIYTMTDDLNEAAIKTYTRCGFRVHSRLTRYKIPLT